MKKTVDAFDHAGHIAKAMPKGILLTTACEGKVNTMTIGWGTIGIEWGKPVFIAYVRESRWTKQLLEKNGEFTVNVPLEGCDSRILGFCGTKSGRDVDKIRELGLTLVEPETISVPGIQELPLTLECRVIYKQKQDLSAMPEDVLARYYPKDAQGNQDDHTAYYGQILNAYIIDD